MRPKNNFLIMLSMALFFNTAIMKAQEKGGCDLCGPASGSNQNIVTGNYSATIGASCEATGTFSFSVGYYAKANASSAMAMGKYVKARATNAIAIGSGTANVDTKALINSIPNSLMVGFNSSAPTLFISNSSGFNSTGKIGIGNVTNPESKLHIKSDDNEDAGIILEPVNSSKKAYFQIYDDKHKIVVSREEGMSFMSQNDKIVLEAADVDINAKLSVRDGILTSEVLVKEVTEWHDYVFYDDYDLKSISDLEYYINANGHLPDMPSEKDIINNGYGMVEMDGLLLKKIEELTLYTIELHKLIENQQKIIETLQSK
ncbi:MAG: hypothetical protein IKW51_00090 [Bacteroidales bacterium]|nr:hypothetical protein [Bacteroidales bacterium]